MNIIKRDNKQWPRDYFNGVLDQFLRGFETDNEMAENTLWTPAVDIKENAENYIVTADLPGVEKENIHISLENNTLTIKGERKYEKDEKTEEGFTRKERFQGQFYRRFVLPETTDESKIKAKYRHGVLEVIIPKKEDKKLKRIEVKIE